MTKRKVLRRLIGATALVGGMLAVPLGATPASATQPTMCYLGNGGQAFRTGGWIDGVGISQVTCNRPVAYIEVAVSVTRAWGDTLVGANVNTCTNTAFCQVSASFWDISAAGGLCYKAAGSGSAAAPVVPGEPRYFCSN